VCVYVHIDKSIRQVACGQGFTLFVTKQGQVYSSGVGRYGQLGLGALKQAEGITLIDSIPERVVTCAAGDRHSLFVTEQGHVYSCGYGKRGELGLGTTCRRVETPQRIESLAREQVRIVQVAAGHGFSVALSDTGKVDIDTGTVFLPSSLISYVYIAI
jgi:alpha-tubulin suppressor-like RCC1 family protein